LLMASCTDTDASGTAQLSLADLGRFLTEQDNAVRTALYDKADAGDPQWYELPLAASDLLGNYTIGSKYRKDAMGVVHLILSCGLKGGAAPVPNGTLIAILPEGYRPLVSYHVPAYDYYWLKDQLINIGVDGRITVSTQEQGTIGNIYRELLFTTG
ncbi:hypothetical protein, partial [uncultured Oscillibacter sp.]|uniref:hypothetical protein n=2 Tax=uncultured Oscillibacter sp. TaxID=876091 RepID=UPI00261AA270